MRRPPPPHTLYTHSLTLWPRSNPVTHTHPHLELLRLTATPLTHTQLSGEKAVIMSQINIVPERNSLYSAPFRSPEEDAAYASRGRRAHRLVEHKHSAEVGGAS